MGPAERCDLVVDFSKFAGQRVVLSSVPQESGAPLAGVLAPAAAADEEILEFRVKPKLKRHKPARKLPAKLRSLPEWTSRLSTTPDRTFVFGQAVAGAGGTIWTINGETYDDTRVVAKPELGSMETWMLVNVSQQSHYIHLHAVDWKVVSRNGGVPAPDEDVLKETFRLDPGETIAVGTRFTDHLGRFLIHCHMLSHEDHAMMTTFEIVAPGLGRPFRAAVRRRRRRGHPRRGRAGPARHADPRRGAAHPDAARPSGRGARRRRPRAVGAAGARSVGGLVPLPPSAVREPVFRKVADLGLRDVGVVRDAAAARRSQIVTGTALGLLVVAYVVGAILANANVVPLFAAGVPIALTLCLAVALPRWSNGQPLLVKASQDGGLRDALEPDEQVLGDGKGLLNRRERFVAVTDRRLLIAESERLIVDAPLARVSRFGIRWDIGQVGTLTVTADGKQETVASVLPANLVSIATALRSRGVNAEDPAAVDAAAQAWEAARRSRRAGCGRRLKLTARPPRP